MCQKKKQYLITDIPSVLNQQKDPPHMHACARAHTHTHTEEVRLHLLPGNVYFQTNA